jgi:hypothetical protein
MSVELVLLRVPATIQSLAEIEDAAPLGTFAEVVALGHQAFPDAGSCQHRLENPFFAGRYVMTCSAVVAVGTGAVVEVSGSQYGDSKELCGSLGINIRRVAALSRPVAGLSNAFRPASYRREPEPTELAIVLEKLATCFGGTLFALSGSRVDPSALKLA